MKPIIFACIFAAMVSSKVEAYYSQFGQDKFVHECFFPKLKNGIFVDIGAHNGIHFSNSCFFEKKMGWNGICFEPIPEIFAELKKNRDCILVQGCVTDWTGPGQFLRVHSSRIDTEMLSGLMKKYDPKHLERVYREVKKHGGRVEIIDVGCYQLHELLEENGITHVNYLSIDIEGGELDVLKTIDFSRIVVDVITVEDNYKDPEITSYLENQGFHLVKKMGCDLVFASKQILKTSP